jgi:hypothetical protein
VSGTLLRDSTSGYLNTSGAPRTPDRVDIAHARERFARRLWRGLGARVRPTRRYAPSARIHESEARTCYLDTIAQMAATDLTRGTDHREPGVLPREDQSGGIRAEVSPAGSFICECSRDIARWTGAGFLDRSRRRVGPCDRNETLPACDHAHPPPHTPADDHLHRPTHPRRKTRREVTRCLKRYLARNLYRLLEHGLPLKA